MLLLPETSSSHLKVDGWNIRFLLGWRIFRGELLVLGSVANSGVHDRPPSLHQLPIITGRWKGEKRHGNQFLVPKIMCWRAGGLGYGFIRLIYNCHLVTGDARTRAIWLSPYPILFQDGTLSLYSTDRDKIAKLSHGDLQRKTYMQLVQLSCFFFRPFSHPPKWQTFDRNYNHPATSRL